MPAWSNSTVLHLIDSIAIAIAQGYMLARVRLISHPSPVVRLTAARDAASWDGQMLERELAVFRQQRERIPAKQRPHYTPTHRLEIRQIMQLRDWSAAETAKRFAVHPNSIRATDSDEIFVQIHRQACRGDPALPIVILKFDRKEAA